MQTTIRRSGNYSQYQNEQTEIAHSFLGEQLAVLTDPNSEKRRNWVRDLPTIAMKLNNN